ncbi:MAG: lysine transporter LysE, partial [Firmicutes bacterium]|nr:lysine transporter LysE [Bacillota bacterium]
MDLLLLFSTAFLVGLSGALMPGPVTAVVAEHTLKKGIVAAPLVVMGHGLMELLV